MRIIHIATAFPRADDDVITPWLVSLLESLRDRGHEVEVLAPAYRGCKSGLFRGIRVHRFRYGPAWMETLTHDETVPDRLTRRPAYAALLPAYLLGGSLAATRIAVRRPDVVHVHWPMPHAWFGGLLRAASGASTAMVSSFYSVELSWVERRIPWLTPFLRWSIETADLVTAISTSTAARVRSVADRPVRIVPFSAAVRPTSERGAPPALGGDGPLQLLFVGRLVERKGVETLVRALPGVLEHREAHLTIVGEGEWEPQIREAINRAGVESRVHMTGRVPEAELERLYESSDIFVLPALVDQKGDTEGLGVVLLEALRFERPIIASDVGGITDIVRHGETGWLVEPDDPPALARRILRVADQPDESRRVAAAGRRWVDERFALPAITSDLIACYEEAVSIRRSPSAPCTRTPGSDSFHAT